MVDQNKSEAEKYFPVLDRLPISNATYVLTTEGDLREQRKWALDFALQNGITGYDALEFAEQILAYVQDGKLPEKKQE